MNRGLNWPRVKALGSPELNELRRIVEEREDKSEIIGEHPVGAHVINIAPHGFWLQVRYKAYFLDFDNFPSFRNAIAAQISSVELLDDDHLYWPELDVDLPLESISHPDQFPRVYTE